MRFILAVLATAAMAIVPAVSSAQSGPYAGAGLGYFTVDTGPFDGSDTAWKVFGGYRFNEYFAGELEYLDGGEPDDGGFEISVDGFNASVVGSWPVKDPFAGFAKVGMLFWDAEARGFGDDSGEDFSWGVGADFDVTDHVTIRGEYQMFEIEDTDSVGLAALSVIWRF